MQGKALWIARQGCHTFVSAGLEKLKWDGSQAGLSQEQKPQTHIWTYIVIYSGVIYSTCKLCLIKIWLCFWIAICEKFLNKNTLSQSYDYLLILKTYIILSFYFQIPWSFFSGLYSKQCLS